MKKSIVRLYQLLGLCLMSQSLLGCTSDIPVDPPTPEKEVITRTVSMSTFKRYTAFNSGFDGNNSVRIPTMTTSQKGTLIVACEGRVDEWKDKSPTRVVVKRSADAGQSWSDQQTVMQQESNEAYMDPLLVADMVTGRVFLFATRWQNKEAQAITNNVYMSYSDDDGISWSAPVEMTDKLCAPGRRMVGHGPGSGLQMKSSKYPNRLILPTRQIVVATKKSEMYTVYSDDHGATWQVGNQVSVVSELQMAEVSNGRLYFNMRRPTQRYTCYSQNGGIDWGIPIADPYLVCPDNGCHASVLGSDSVLFFCSPQGGPRAEGTDNRYDLTLWRSLDDGKTWGQRQVIYPKGAGYSCCSYLPDGRIAIAFEAADTRGFVNTADPRPKGWMRIDVMVLPADLADKSCWIAP